MFNKRENYEKDRADTYITKFKENNRKINIIYVRASPIMEVLTGFMIAFLIYISAKLISAEEI